MELMDILSWTATFFVLVSFLFDGKTLRWINSVGAGLWLIWGIWLGEGAIIFLNGVIIGIHAYKLSIERGENLFATELKKRLGKFFLKDRHGA